MTIESDLKAINASLDRIAETLDGLLASQGVVAEPKTKAAPAKKTPRKKASKKTTVGKQDDEPEGQPPLTKKDVRFALQELKAATNQAEVKSLLKAYGVSTLGQLDEKNYGRIITEARERAE
jgi:hypothetical protein